MATPDLTPNLNSAAAGPLRGSVDGQLVEARSAADMIDADRYLKANAVAASGRYPVRRQKFSRPNPGGVDCGRFYPR